jgi:Zn-dependent protease with chaperone function
MKSAIISIILIVFFQSAVLGQFEKSYKPLPFQDTIPSNLHETLKQRLKADKETVMAKGKVGSYMKTLYEQRTDYLVKTFNEDYFMVEDNLAKYLQSVLNKIYDANPQLPRETNVYPYRSSSPNAISFGEGTLGIMLGLIERIESEDVLAFVLCHELAHYHTGHTAKKIEQLADLNYDRVLKKQIDAIMSNPYGRYTKLKNLFNSLDLSISKHSRETEFEADSIGLSYFLKTTYNRAAPLRCMQILSSADSNTFKRNIDFKKYFSFREFPFKESWIDYQPSDVWHALPEHAGSDTAQTHPNCDKRFFALKRQLRLTDSSPSVIRKGKLIPSVADQASFEIVSTLYHYRQYGKAMFHAIVLAEKFPGNAYAHAMICKSLYQLYRAQKNHEFGKVMELPDPRFEENYNRFLSFIHKLRLFEMANLAYHYAATRPEPFYSDEEFLHALWMCSKLEVSKVDPEKVRIDYEALYPKGRYISEMKKY